MDLPLVSCIVPVFNGETTVAETLQSLFSQTYPRLEIIVVDDGSADSTLSVLKPFAGRVKVLQRPHAGPSAARNAGIAEASGAILSFLDADDLWHPDKIRSQVEHFREKPELQASFVLVKNFWSPEASAEKERFEKQGLVKLVHPFCLSSFAAKREVFEKLGLFREDLVIGEDSEWFTRMKNAGIPYEILPVHLLSRRLHARNLTRDLSFVTREEIQQRALEAVQRSRAAKPEKNAETAGLSPEETRKAAERFFEESRQAFERAEKSRPDSVRKYYSAAGFSFEVRFAGAAAAAQMASALEHLETPPVPNPALSIGLCFFRPGETGMPAVPWPEPEFNAKMEIPGYDDDEHVRATYYARPETLHIFHGGRNQGYFFMNGVDAVPLPDRGAPVARIFRWWLRRRKIQLVHGAVVGLRGSGVLLAGQGGVGKSTTALACLAEGFSYVSDDYCLLSSEEPYRAYSLYCTGKMRTEDLGRVPRLKALEASGEADPRSGKTFFFLNRLFPKEVTLEIPVRAVLVPVISAQSESELVKASPIVALKALAPSTLFQLPGSRQHDFYDLARVVEKLPCYVLRLGSSMPGVTRVIADYLSSPAEPRFE